MNYDDIFPKVAAHAKEYGFIFQSSEIYDGLGAVYDYGQLGVQLKRNITESWWKAMVQMHDNIVGLDSAILMHPTVWKASGHVDAFSDPLIDNKDSKKRYRADMLLEDYIEKIYQKARKEAAKRAEKEGWETGGEEYTRFLQNSRNGQKAREAEETYAKVLERDDLGKLRDLIVDWGIADPESGSKNWSEVRQFNLMFKTQLGATADGASDIFLRPETAQGIFVNFLNVMKSGRMKIPFGIAQIGKAFRNEIVARQFIFRMREFEQMEMQFFIEPGTQQQWFEYWKEKRIAWHKAMGLDPHKLRWHAHEKLAHYADAAEDIQFMFPFGFKELEGIHSRTDFDLANHETYSGKKLRYFDSEKKENIVPYVIETSVGVDRTFLSQLCNAYAEEEVSTGDRTETRTVLRLHPMLAPYKAAVFPLIKNDDLIRVSMGIFDELKYDQQVFYEEKDTIGRRYRRHDAIGTPYCITVDFDSLEDQAVTIRERDSMEQERVPIAGIREYISRRLSWKELLGS
jgi:glycyl-tRNA synthetase